MIRARLCLCSAVALGACVSAPIDDSGLDTEVGQLRRDVRAAVQPVLVRDADWRVSADGALFREMFRRINALPLDSRTVKLTQSADASAPLLTGGRGRMSWFVEIPPGRRLWLQTQLVGIEADWLQSGQLQVGADLAATGEVPLHGVFDPGPGTGIGTTVLFNASGRARVTGTAALTQSALGKVHYRLAAAEPTNLALQVCVRVKLVGNLCRDAELDPKFANALEGDFDLGAETRGMLKVPGQDPLSYRLKIHDAVLTTDAAGVTTQGKVTIEWDRDPGRAQPAPAPVTACAASPTPAPTHC
jgi:hypothetical protein